MILAAPEAFVRPLRNVALGLAIEGGAHEQGSRRFPGLRIPSSSLFPWPWRLQRTLVACTLAENLLGVQVGVGLLIEDATPAGAMR